MGCSLERAGRPVIGRAAHPAGPSTPDSQVRAPFAAGRIPRCESRLGRLDSGSVGEMHSEEIEIRTGHEETVVDLSEQVTASLRGLSGDDGLLNAWVPHATAGLAVIETGAGSDTDLLAALRELLPADDRWRHRHGSTGHGRDHVLPAIIAPSMSVPVLDGRTALGTWQSVCLVAK